MFTTAFFRPLNFALIAVIALGVAWIFGAAKHAMDGASVGAPSPANPAPGNPLSNQ